MDRTAALLWSYLAVLTKRRMEAIANVYGNLDDPLKHLSEEFLKSLGCREETVRAALMRLEQWNPERYQQELTRHGVRFLTLDDDDYPSLLRNIADPPPFLYAKGDLSILNHPCIALVGTRQMSQYGKRIAGHLVAPLVHAGAVTVSGLALGVDAEVAKETLLARGKTVAVLAHGLSMIYPQSHTAMAKEILAQGGLLVSELPLDMPPGQQTFVARNRIIAGLSLGTVVIEAPEGSGALQTAEFALEEGRDVFVLPGSIFDANFAGCHNLLRRGQAKLVTDAADILEDVGIVMPTQERSSYVPENDDERAVYAALTTMPKLVDDVVTSAKLAAPRVSAALTMMELAGAVKNVGAGQWVKA